ncbi:hypothetical protein [Bradyrhizobium sp. 187]|uniref:hypothetical protein n=1 Tax=Bradyrhizobium sp. 187 TaxID=2782655 RepID=UPI001FFF7EF3|nr:hypothetical protein [Bradyrhizobium sp. 187]UPJ69880.1 hypothetical protein IVB19_19270 [Bradyrhizobium sp. 187]
MLFRLVRRAALAIAFVAACFPALAQTFPTVPSGTVIGRTAIGTGPSQEIPITSLIASMLNPLTVTSVNTASVVYRGATSGTATISAQAVAGTPVIKWPTTSGTVPTTATLPIVLNATTGVLSCPTCALTIDTRTAAAALNLSAYNVIRTGGYATAGDGGGATFKNVGSTAFLDNYITSASLTGGSGYTNGSYLGVPLTGALTTGNCLAAITVSGGAVTAVTTTMPCAASSVGSVLSTSNTYIGGTGSGFKWTVTAVSTPQASFTDSAGNHWQFVETEGSTNALQFGCKGDWGGIGSDASSTNNSPCLWSALAFVSLKSGWVGGYGGHLVIPKGAFMTCGQFLASGFNLPIPQSVRVSGTSIFGTTLAECAADTGSTHYVGLCDAVAKVGQFGCKVENMTLYLWQVTTASAGIAAIYSNSGQQFALAENVEVDAYHRSCVKYETGAGGAANDIWIGIDCVQEGAATNPGFSFSALTSQHILQRSVCASGPAGAAVCINNSGGRLIADGIDIEGYGTGLQYQVTTSGVIGSYKNVQEQSGSCSQAIQLTASNLPGNLVIENISTGCPVTVLNQQSGGTNFTGNIVKQITCVSGACN